MTIESPVWKDEAELIRYTAMPPKSSAAPQRRIGTRGYAFRLAHANPG